MSKHDHSAPVITDEDRARVPINYRDECTDLLVQLNKCRFENYYLPWKCTHERHLYEVCEYKLYLKRLRNKTE